MYKIRQVWDVLIILLKNPISCIPTLWVIALTLNATIVFARTALKTYKLLPKGRKNRTRTSIYAGRSATKKYIKVYIFITTALLKIIQGMFYRKVKQIKGFLLKQITRVENILLEAISGLKKWGRESGYWDRVTQAIDSRLDKLNTLLKCIIDALRTTRVQFHKHWHNWIEERPKLKQTLKHIKTKLRTLFLLPESISRSQQTLTKIILLPWQIQKIIWHLANNKRYPGIYAQELLGIVYRSLRDIRLITMAFLLFYRIKLSKQTRYLDLAPNAVKAEFIEALTIKYAVLWAAMILAYIVYERSFNKIQRKRRLSIIAAFTAALSPTKLQPGYYIWRWKHLFWVEEALYDPIPVEIMSFVVTSVKFTNLQLALLIFFFGYQPLYRMLSKHKYAWPFWVLVVFSILNILACWVLL